MAIRLKPFNLVKLSEPDHALELEIFKTGAIIEAAIDSLRFEELKAEFSEAYPRGIDDPAFI